MIALVVALFMNGIPAHAEDALIIEPVTPAEEAMAAADSEASRSGGAAGRAAPDPAIAESMVEEESLVDEKAGTWDVEYFAIFYGPGLSNPSAYTPTAYGEKDLTHPVTLRNFIGAGYNVTDQIAVTPTASWLWNPVGSQALVLQDPFIRLSHASLLSTPDMNLYSDVRFHIPVTRLSQDEKLRLGVQTFHALTYDIPTTRFSLGLYSSARVNFFGDQAFGNDLELYLAPNINYQFTDGASVILTYEMNATHVLGTKAWSLNNTGTDLQPGVAWLVTPRLLLSPYLNLNTGGRVSLESTSFGFSMAYRMI